MPQPNDSLASSGQPFQDIVNREIAGGTREHFFAAANRLTGQMGVAFGITTLTMVYGGVDTGAAFATAFLVGAALSIASLALALFMRVRERVKETPLVPEPFALGAEEQG